MEKKENRPQHKTICKPFKETGYCGYGDTCKYAHERFVEYEDVSSEHASCLYCKSSFREPVTTLCGHTFCSYCAVEIFFKDDSCIVCSQPTLGRFTVNEM